jgi:PAS domain S-box-containing protein
MTILNHSSDTSKLNFHDLFDVEAIQNIQDAFAAATGVASIITDTNGVPITQPSNFCDLCQNIIRKTEKGLTNCYKSDAILGQANTGGPTVQPCLSGGLLDGGTSIMAGDQHVANWLIGQVLNDSCDIEAMKAYAREIGADEELYCQALGKVTRMPKEKFDQICQMLFLIAKQLSEQALLILTQETSQRLLIESEERFKALHDASFGGVIIHNKGKILDCNQSLSDITGYKNEELIGMDGLKLIAPDSLDLVLKNIQSGYDLQYEVEGLRKDGSIYPLAIRGKNIQYKGSEARVVEFRDISAHREALRALRDSEERFRQVAMTNWVWETDLEGRYTYCSDNVIETLGYTSEEMIGKTPFDFMPDQEAIRVNGVFAELIAEKKRIIDVENWNVTKEGSPVCMLTNGVPFFDKAGNLIGYRGGAKDITDRKRTEEVLAKHQEQLEILVEDRTRKLKDAQSELMQSERLATLGRLTATVSHEIRNPLGTIQTAIFSIDNFLERNELHQVKLALELAERNILRCVNIIDDLTSYTRIKKLVLTKTFIDDWLKMYLGEQTIPKKIRCELDLQSGVCASIDQEKLWQVMNNLINNAVHALLDENSKGDLLHISTQLLDGEYEIRVRDNGIGMSDETKEKVFEPLYSTKGFGVGLGMVITKGIVEQHHGEISIESVEGKGSTITLRLPIKPPEEKAQ